MALSSLNLISLVRRRDVFCVICNKEVSLDNCSRRLRLSAFKYTVVPSLPNRPKGAAEGCEDIVKETTGLLKFSNALPKPCQEIGDHIARPRT